MISPRTASLTTSNGASARTVARIADVPAAAWDALFDSPYPFTRHAFLNALEAHGCVGGRTGWEPCHLLIEQDGRLAAAMPLYRKRHSYGEFVFDFAWARASEQLGASYYPKLLNAVPFTPVAGPRFGAASAAARAGLLAAAKTLWDGSDSSSLHALFLEPDDAAALAASTGALERADVQFQWHNRGYASFDAFLAQLQQPKRKKILRERRRVTEAGLRFEVRGGDELAEGTWAQVYALYCNTYEERGQPPYLSLDFFLDYGRAAATPLRLILAWDGAALVAVAITLSAGGVLYGRHWGCAQKYHSLHFETCYYQGIELCIHEGLTRFDAGTQGEHKLARGFDPQPTRSMHLLADGRLRSAVADFLVRERRAMARQHEVLMAHSAYKGHTIPMQEAHG